MFKTTTWGWHAKTFGKGYFVTGSLVTKARQNFAEVETYPVVEPPDEDDLFDENEDDEDL